MNTASMAALTGMPFTGAYTMSKHAVLALSETLYHELRAGREDRRLCALPGGGRDRHRARRAQSGRRICSGRRAKPKGPSSSSSSDAIRTAIAKGLAPAQSPIASCARSARIASTCCPTRIRGSLRVRCGSKTCASGGIRRSLYLPGNRAFSRAAPPFPLGHTPPARSRARGRIECRATIDSGSAASGRSPSTGATIEVVSPFTEQVIGRVPEAAKADVDKAVAAARKAFDEARGRASPPPSAPT